MDEQNDRNVLVSVLAGVGLGALVGAAVALLFAPKAGTETRDDVRHTLDDLKDKAERVAGDLVARAEELASRGKGLVDEASVRIKEAVAAGREAVQQAEAESDTEGAG